MRNLKRSNRSRGARSAPRIIPAIGENSPQPTGPRGEPKPALDYRDPTPLPHVAQRGFIAIVPVVGSKPTQVSPAAVLPMYQHTRPVPATALAARTLPLPDGYLPTPPSARYVDQAVTK